MSDETAAAKPDANPAPHANPAQQAFGKYRTRLAAFPDPGSPWGAGQWPAPPSVVPMGAAPGKAGAMGSLGERLGDTVKLSIDLLNATLYGAANILAGLGAEERRCGCGCDDARGGCGCGSGGDRCGDCCDQMGVPCCRPNVSGCGCGCC
jgi:hypothetical protein